MNLFAVLRKQVKAALNIELSHDAEIRELFDWRYSVDVGGQQYIVGKTGANTCFYQGPQDPELVAVYPDELVKQIDKWGSNQFLMFRMYMPDKDKICGHDSELSVVKAVFPPKYIKGMVIQGIKFDGSIIDLYRLKKGLSGMKWVKIDKT